MNQVIIVGRIIKISNKYVSISVSRPYKNDKGIYENDIIISKIEGGLYQQVKKYCNQGDIIGIKGALRQENNHNMVVAEKITFLSRKSDGDNL